MSAENPIALAALQLAVLCGLSGGATAAADEEPELEFLEYLGSWEGSDEDWLLFDEVDSEQVKADDERRDPAPTAEESTENDDDD
jgi:hypothetical protein